MTSFGDANRRTPGFAAVNRRLSRGSIGAGLQPGNVPTATQGGLPAKARDHADHDEGRQDNAADDEPQCRSIHPDILGALDQAPVRAGWGGRRTTKKTPSAPRSCAAC